jgi:hypothetical protein
MEKVMKITHADLDFKERFKRSNRRNGCSQPIIANLFRDF